MQFSILANSFLKFVSFIMRLINTLIGILESTTHLNGQQAAQLLDECGGSVADALISLQRQSTE